MLIPDFCGTTAAPATQKPLLSFGHCHGIVRPLGDLKFCLWELGRFLPAEHVYCIFRRVNCFRNSEYIFVKAGYFFKCSVLAFILHRIPIQIGVRLVVKQCKDVRLIYIIRYVDPGCILLRGVHNGIAQALEERIADRSLVACKIRPDKQQKENPIYGLPQS